MRRFLILFGLCVSAFVSAGPPKFTSHFTSTANVVKVPYELQGGVKTIHVSLNGLGVEMIFDTGCSTTLISKMELQYMYNRGLITDEDFIGEVYSTIADGSVVSNLEVVLREVKLAEGLAFYDVIAHVSPNIEAPLLLGNEVLNRVESFKIDNVENQIIFKLK